MNPSNSFLMDTYSKFPIQFNKGYGGYLWDINGRKYIDFVMGIATCSLGHCHESITKALKDQSEKLIHCSNLYHVQEQEELASFIVNKIMGGKGKVFFCNSGTESTDALIKLSRKNYYLKKKDSIGEIITCNQSFHGRSIGGISATGQNKVKDKFHPLLQGFKHIKFNDLKSLEKSVNEKTAAIFFEPVQGEGGINSATKEFIELAYHLCKKFNCMLMFDEVQCGLGRLGNWRAWESILNDSNNKIFPNAISWAKGLGGGVPIGAIWADEEYSIAFDHGSHGSTFGGNPLASSVSMAVLQEIESSNLVENAFNKGEEIKKKVSSLNLDLISEIKGKGLMLGFLINKKILSYNNAFINSNKTPSQFISIKLLENGLLTVPSGSSVIRFLPRLNVTSKEIDEAIDIFNHTLSSLI